MAISPVEQYEDSRSHPTFIKRIKIIRPTYAQVVANSASSQLICFVVFHNPKIGIHTTLKGRYFFCCWLVIPDDFIELCYGIIKITFCTISNVNSIWFYNCS